MTLREYETQHKTQQNAGWAAPHNIDIEQAVLGAMLMNADTVSAVLDIVTSRHFYDPVHGRIVEAIATQADAGRLVSPVALAALFANDQLLPDLTVAQYLGRLAAVAAHPTAAKDLAITIRDLATRRGLMALADQIGAMAADTTQETAPGKIIEVAEASLYELADKAVLGVGSMAFTSAVDQALARVTEAYRNGNAVKGISTGLRDLDAKLGGLQPGEVTIIAGRPGIGKSALALNMAFDVALHGTPVDFYSLEMTSSELATRILSDRVAIGSDKLRRGQISSDEYEALMSVGQSIRGSPLYIDQTGGISISQLTARARKQKRQRQTGLIVVDYLQLMRASRPSNNRVQDVAEITTGLKALAKELEVPVIALSQLSRQVESRDNKRPMLADLRESGSIEQDADVVMFVYREEYYVEREKPDMGHLDAYADWDARMASCRGLGEIIIGKSRHSSIGAIPVKWDGARTRFFDLGGHA